MEKTGRLLRGVATIAAILALTCSLGAAAQGAEESFVKAQATFERGLRGSESDNEAAAEQFRRLTETDTGNPLYLAYYGSTFAVKARDAWLPWKKLKLGEQGLDLIDKALKRLTPEHDKLVLRQVPLGIETRLVAINTFFQVPDRFFHRYESGKTLLAETMTNPAFALSPPRIQARFHSQTALVAQKEGRKADEAAQLKRVLELDPQTPDAAQLHTRLKELGA
ncbi:MAG: hypothetical protein WCV99_04375 [Sterolibacterium sp.]|jgi:Tfp pilus assembly protein PilF